MKPPIHSPRDLVAQGLDEMNPSDQQRERSRAAILAALAASGVAGTSSVAAAATSASASTAPAAATGTAVAGAGGAGAAAGSSAVASSVAPVGATAGVATSAVAAGTAAGAGGVGLFAKFALAGALVIGGGASAIHTMGGVSDVGQAGEPAPAGSVATPTRGTRGTPAPVHDALGAPAGPSAEAEAAGSSAISARDEASADNALSAVSPTNMDHPDVEVRGPRAHALESPRRQSTEASTVPARSTSETRPTASVPTVRAEAAESGRDTRPVEAARRAEAPSALTGEALDETGEGAAGLAPAPVASASNSLAALRDRLREEAVRLQRAQRLQSRGEHEAALQLLARPGDPRLAPERGVLRVLSLCGLGRTADARREAARLRAGSMSPALGRLRTTCVAP